MVTRTFPELRCLPERNDNKRKPKGWKVQQLCLPGSIFQKSVGYCHSWVVCPKFSIEGWGNKVGNDSRIGMSEVLKHLHSSQGFSKSLVRAFPMGAAL